MRNRLPLQLAPQLAQHRVTLRRLVSGQGVGPGALQLAHEFVDLHAGEMGPPCERVETLRWGHLPAKSICFSMRLMSAYWGHFAGKKPEISTNGSIRSESRIAFRALDLTISMARTRCQKVTLNLFDTFLRSKPQFHRPHSKRSCVIGLREPDDFAPCETTKGREYEHTGRTAARADEPRQIWPRCRIRLRESHGRN